MPRTRPFLRALAVLSAIGLAAIAGQAGFTRASSPRTVHVKWGDTLWGISLRYRVTMNQLAVANGMKPADVLVTGRRLKIPGAAGPAVAGASATQPRNFCSTYVPPTGPRGSLPSMLLAHPERLALRPLFVKWAGAYGVPPDLMEALAWQESGWQNSVVSSAKARGVGQLLPSTVDFVNEVLLPSHSDSTGSRGAGSRGAGLNPAVAADNIRMSAAFLGSLLRATGGKTCEAVAAYYEGLAALRHSGVLAESQAYVRSVSGLRPYFR